MLVVEAATKIQKVYRGRKIRREYMAATAAKKKAKPRKGLWGSMRGKVKKHVDDMSGPKAVNRDVFKAGFQFFVQDVVQNVRLRYDNFLEGNALVMPKGKRITDIRVNKLVSFILYDMYRAITEFEDEWGGEPPAASDGSRSDVMPRIGVLVLAGEAEVAKDHNMALA